MKGRNRGKRCFETLALLGVLLFALGAGPYESLRPAAEIPHLDRLDRLSAGIARETMLLDAGGLDGEPLRLAAEHLGSGSSDVLLVMLHGVLSNRSLWRFMAADLARDHDVLLIDLLGCGESDRPDPRRVGSGGYGPTAQARRVLLALDTYARRWGLPERVVIVGHSLGGAVALRMLGAEGIRSEFPALLARVDSAVLFAPLDFAVEKEHPTFAAVARLGRFKVGLARGLGILKNVAGRITRNTYVDPDAAPREGADRLIDIIRRRKLRRPAQAMILQAVPFDRKSRRPDWDAIEELVDDYANVRVPTLIVWGERDETLPVSMGYKLQAEIPAATLRIVERSMHSLPTERPVESSRLVRTFVQGRAAGEPIVAHVAVPEGRDPVAARGAAE